MKVIRLLAFLTVGTVLGLFYVHQNVEQVKLSYAIDHREKGVSVLLDQQEKLIYNLHNLSSPSRLERVLVAQNVEVGYPKREQVIMVAEGRGRRTSGALQFARRPKKGLVDNVLEIVGMGPEAQARER